jgi:hypothetical protein
MRELKDPRLLHLKAALFLLLGTLAAVGVILVCPTLQVALMLAVAVWAFARLYYYAFYVLERYVDPTFRYSGLASLVLYLMTRRSESRRAP